MVKRRRKDTLKNNFELESAIGEIYGEEVKLLRAADVSRKTRLPRTSIYRLMCVAGFPQPIRVTERTVAWFEHEVDEWLDERRKEREEKKQEIQAKALRISRLANRHKKQK